MAINKDVNIKITTENENPQSWKELNGEIKATRSELVKLQAEGKIGSAEWDKYADKLRNLAKEKQIVQRQTKLTSQQLLGLSRDLVVVGTGFKNVATEIKNLASGKQSIGEITESVGNLTFNVLALTPAIVSLSRSFTALGGVAGVLGSAFGALLSGVVALASEVTLMVNAFSNLDVTFTAVKRLFEGDNVFDIWAESTKRLTAGIIDFTNETNNAIQSLGDLLLLSSLTGQAFENEKRIQDYQNKYKEGGEFFGKYKPEEEKVLIDNFKKLVKQETEQTTPRKNEIKVTQPNRYKAPKVTVEGQDNLNIIDEYRKKIFDLEKKLQQIEKDGGLGSSLWIKTKEELNEASIELQAFGVNLKNVGDTSLKLGVDLEKVWLPQALEKEVEEAIKLAEIYKLQNKELVTYSELMDEILAKKEYAEALRNAIDTTVSGFQTIFGLLSEWTGDATSGVSRFFKTIEQSFGILQQMITFMETIKAISEAIKAVEVASGAKGSGSGNFFEGLIGFVTQFFADGGLVQGAGTGTSDSIPARLSNGEFVVNAKSTRAFYPLLELINGRSRNTTNAFSTGGFVNMSSGQGTPIYIMANMDGLTFMRVNEPKYKHWKQSVKV